MTTTYELYTNENGTPKAVEGKAPAIIERVEALETSVESLEDTLDNDVVTSVNGNKGDITPEQTGCLPLGGGTLEGKVEVKGNGEFRNFDDSHDMAILGGNNWENGAFVQVTGQNHSGGGQFQFAARSSSGSSFLQGFPWGSLMWQGVEIERVAEVGVDYVRYHSGWQICHGSAGTGSNGGVNVQFPLPFINQPNLIPVILGTMGSGGLWSVLYQPIDGLQANIWAFDPNGGHAQVGVNWIAIGRWK